jgi:hypothetical protein
MDTQRPAIFTLVAVPIIGKLGRNSKIVERPPCKVCGVSYREEVTILDYEFDTWERAELIKAGHDNYAITRRLFGVFEKAGLKGMATETMKVSRGKIFDRIDPEHKIKIPEFMRLIITGKADGPSGWWERGPTCPACGRPQWKRTEAATKALFSTFSKQPAPPRLVSAATWQGDDAFWLTDPGPPVVTNRFEQVVKGEKVEGVVLEPAEWIA